MVLAHWASYNKETLARKVIPLAPGYWTALLSRPEAIYNMHINNFNKLMYQSKPSFNILPSGHTHLHLALFPAWEGENLMNLEFPGVGFDHHSWGVGNLIASLHFMLRVMLIPHGLMNHGKMAKTNFDEFKGKDYGFVADWLKTKGLNLTTLLNYCFSFTDVSNM